MEIQRHPLPLLGFLAGLVTGLAICAVIALYLTNSPVPFVNKVQRATDAVTPEPGDPNRPLFSAQIPSGPGSDPAPAHPALPPAAAAPGPGSGTLPVPVPVPAQVGSSEAAAGGAEAESGARLMLQVGAYRSADDADTVRARLALLGLDAKVTEIKSDGATLYRVRLGPYGQLDDLNGIRRTLSENGMEPQIVHVR